MQKQLPITLAGAAQQRTESSQEPSFLAAGTPRRRLADLRRRGHILPFIEQLIKRNFESATNFLQRFDRRDGVTVLDA